MKNTQHRRSALFLIANLGPEVSRILSFKEKNDLDLMDASLKRAKHIIAELSALPEMQSRMGELNLLSQAIADGASSAPALSISPKNLKAYFQPFVLRLIAMG